MNNKTPGINLAEWIKRPTKQGLPRKDSESGDLYYWAPTKDNNSIVWFGASSDWANLDCGRGSSYRDSDLGVRAAEQDKTIKLARSSYITYFLVFLGFYKFH